MKKFESNEVIGQLMREQGIANLSKLARLSGVSSQALANMDMKGFVPISKYGTWKGVVVRLAKFFNLQPCDLFKDYPNNDIQLKSEVSESQRTKEWMRDNPEKAKALQESQRERKVALQNEAIDAWKHSPYKTMGIAIRAFCHSCPHGTFSRDTPKSPVFCDKKGCPLFPYRNGNPMSIQRGKKFNSLYYANGVKK